MNIQVGDIVRHIIYGYEGQVVGEFENYWDASKDESQFVSMRSTAWLEQQAIPHTQEQVNNQKWFSVNCFDGGSILTCESWLDIIERIDVQAIFDTCK